MQTFSLVASTRAITLPVRVKSPLDGRVTKVLPHPRAVRVHNGALVLERGGRLPAIVAIEDGHAVVLGNTGPTIPDDADVNALAPMWRTEAPRTSVPTTKPAAPKAPKGAAANAPAKGSPEAKAQMAALRAKQTPKGSKTPDIAGLAKQVEQLTAAMAMLTELVKR
jgi:hypothetical protein